MAAFIKEAPYFMARPFKIGHKILLLLLDLSFFRVEKARNCSANNFSPSLFTVEGELAKISKRVDPVR